MTEWKIKESENRDQYKTLPKKLKKLRDFTVTVIPVVIDALERSPKAWKEDDWDGNRMTNWHHTDYSIVKISENNVKRSGELRRLALTQDTKWKTIRKGRCEKLTRSNNKNNNDKHVGDGDTNCYWCAWNDP